jgi:threonylcarbamoyladenosine tRNA methylthiotransferase MtaB
MRVHLTNLGCKLNQAEVEQLGRDFLAAGHELVDSLAAADLHVVNTCTVTQAAARASRKAAGRARRLAAGRPIRTVLTGCYASERPEEAARLPGVDLVVPNAGPDGGKERLLETVERTFGLERPARPADGAAAARDRAAAGRGARLPAGNTRALLKVEDGCSMHCTYCIIPATRGAQRSRPLPQLLAEAGALVEAGHRELVVTGVQISAWRDGRERLEGLARALLAALPPWGVRLRLTSIAPWQLDARLLALWADRRLCRHLHLSLQSGSSAVLRRMRRPYTAETYARLLERVRAAIPGVAVTTDVIVGFPGESEAEFAESLARVEALGFAKVHVFPFSARLGTAAAGLPGQLAPAALRARAERMLAAAAGVERRFRQAQLGRRETVLWERPREGCGNGLTDTYVRVWCAAAAGLVNRFAEVELVALAEDGVTARLVA